MNTTLNLQSKLTPTFENKQPIKTSNRAFDKDLSSYDNSQKNNTLRPSMGITTQVYSENFIKNYNSETEEVIPYEEKTKKVYKFLSEKGIPGEIVGCTAEYYPQNYAFYYVQDDSKPGKTTVIFEYENGDFTVSETTNSIEHFKLKMNLFVDEFNFTGRKYSVDELKNLFEKFMEEYI